MNYMLIRKALGIIVIICGIVSGILIFYSSMKTDAIRSFILNTKTSSSIQSNISVSDGLGVLNILLKGFSFGIFGICLALGTMVYKVGSGKERIVLNLKEDKMEAAMQYNEPVVSKQEVNDSLLKQRPDNLVEYKNNPGTEDLKPKSSLRNGKLSHQKRNLFLAIASLLILLNIVFIVLIFKNR